MTERAFRDLWTLPNDDWPEKGGNDKIFGGDNGTGLQNISGGPYDDKIWSGNGVGSTI